MHQLLPLIALGLALGLGPAQAAAPAGAAQGGDKPAAAGSRTPQQNRMATCNKEAGDRKGEERKAFMSDCLKSKPVSQQDRMKRCNADAKGMKGDERKKFMSECLKKG